MTRKRVSKEEKQQRHEWSMKQIDKGVGFSELASLVAARMAMWGREANVRLHPHRCRHTHATHAIRRGVDVFTLSASLGHSSTGTTSHYVLAEPGESSSLQLG